MIKKEVHVFFAALLFFTRIPCPKKIEVRQEHFEKSAKYLPLVGWFDAGRNAEKIK